MQGNMFAYCLYYGNMYCRFELCILCPLQVVSVDMNPHYFNSEEAVRTDVYTAEVNNLVTFANVFAQSKAVVRKVAYTAPLVWYSTVPMCGEVSCCYRGDFSYTAS